MRTRPLSDGNWSETAGPRHRNGLPSAPGGMAPLVAGKTKKKKLLLKKKKIHFFTGHTICTHLVGSLGSKFFFFKENKLRFIQIFSGFVVVVDGTGDGTDPYPSNWNLFLSFKRNNKMIIKGKHLQGLHCCMRILIQRTLVVGMQCPAKWAETDFSLIQPIKSSSFNLFQLERMKLVNWIEWSFHPLNDRKPHSCNGTQFLVGKKKIFEYFPFFKKNTKEENEAEMIAFTWPPEVRLHAWLQV